MGKTRRHDPDGARPLPKVRRHERRTVKDRLALLSWSDVDDLSEDELYLLEDELWPEREETD